MSVDLSQFHQVFFDESFEGLDIMETGLLELEPGSTAVDDINTIFRAAHSIKGGAGTFGFQMVSEFTHVAETLLDEYRSSARPVEQEGIDLLLEAVDELRSILGALQADSDVDMSNADSLKVRFNELLASKTETGTVTEAAGSSAQSSTSKSDPTNFDSDDSFWRIKFIPARGIIQTGNEPMRIFRELMDLGRTEVTCYTDTLPAFASLDPEELFLHWQIDLFANCSESSIQDVFEWVIDDCVVEITYIDSANTAVVADEKTIETEPDTAEPLAQGFTEPSQPSSATAVIEAQKKTVSVKAAKSVIGSESQSIRVGIDKIDSLINLVGELVITQSMLGQIGHDFSIDKLQRLQEGLMQLEQNTREMQESVMRIRMVPISFSFSRFPRLVRDTAKKLKKKINLVMLGESTELDKTVMEKIGDPLVHMVRNSMDHGIEAPDIRQAQGKKPEGTLTLNAYHQGGNIVIEIADDGKGIDPQVIGKKAIQNGLMTEEDQYTDQQLQELIFHPGLSTAEIVSDLSGRGVGMDVVRRNIQELKGSVELDSKVGEGSTFRIKLPLTLSILDGQLVRLGEETFVLPLTSIIESIEVSPDQISSIAGELEVIVLRDEYVPVVRLYEVFNIEPENKSIFDGLVVVVESGKQKIGLHVDDLLSQQQVVIKSLDTNYKRIEGLSGATILGDGTVALILDITGLMNIVGDRALSSVIMKTAS
ncbi:MAG: chemotaxis protein CheA [Reinekea sp.]|jgi:two-component system, chemotaxis family, sensor kinase CheA